MPTVRLTAGAYDQPWPSFDEPKDRETTLRRQGDVFQVTDKELERLEELGVVDEFKGDQEPDQAIVEFAEQQLERARAEHETLSQRDGVTAREVQLSEDRLHEAERAVSRFKDRGAKTGGKRGQAAVDAAAAGESQE